MASDARLGTIRTQIPARLDRLPWARFHTMVVLGLGTAWILDGLEVTMVGNVAARLTEPGSGVDITPAHIGQAAAIYVAGACIGALFFGELTDRHGRKKLFMITLVIYLTATTLTALTFSPWWFFLCRFFTGFGIGGEYAAINSAIDELIPARHRGRVDLGINGSYWLGAANGALLAVVMLNAALFALDLGWRLAFAIGLVLGIAVLIVRRHVPESPRWMFIHGHDEAAEELVDEIERRVERETGRTLPPASGSITVRQRRSLRITEILEVAFRVYPKRSVLCLALFLGQAFLYNAVTFNLGTLLSSYFGVSSGAVPYYFAVYALGSLAGPLLLGPLFDSVGRKPMVAGTYFAASALLVVTALLMQGGVLGSWSFLVMLVATFFFASAGSSAAYLTVSEIFPMETRALAIAVFYAIGTAAGGIAGPLLFGAFIDSGDVGLVALGFYIGAGAMAIGGLAEVVFGIEAAGRSLEDIAPPLTAHDDRAS